MYNFSIYHRLSTIVAVAASLSLSQLVTPATANAASRLPSSVPTAAISKATKLGSTEATKTIQLAISLPLRDQAGLKHLISQLYDHSSPQYGKFLKPKEFAARFGPTDGDYNAVKSYLVSRGLTVTGEFSNHDLIDVQGSVRAVQTAFGVKFSDYKGSDGRVFYAPDAAATVPDVLAGKLIGLSGLSDAYQMHPMLSKRPSAGAGNPMFSPLSLKPNTIGTGPDGGYTPSDVRTAYNLNASDGVTETGKGQVMALFEQGTRYTPSDATYFEQYFGLSAPTINEIYVDGTPEYDYDYFGEETLDIDMFLDLASSASTIELYEGIDTNLSVGIDILAKIATDDSASVVSSSWGITETFEYNLQAENNSLMQMATQGQTFFVASGDDGAYDDGYSNGLAVDDPGSQPYACDVGGTSMLTSSPGGSWTSESTWEGTTAGTESNGGGSGGGVSVEWTTPSYQDGLASYGSPASSTYRNVPDVALNAAVNDAGCYEIYESAYGGFYLNGGTSAAAPLWTAMTALANQRRDSNALPKIGFINPTLYEIGESQGYSTTFHDITTLNNLYYNATTGYDNATGWGSYIGGPMIQELTFTVPSIYPTIQAAINAAGDGAVISIAAGTYTGLGNVNLNTNGKAITLLAAGGPGSVIIDCQGSGNGFSMTNGEGSSTVIEGITVKNGFPSDGYGGAADIDNSSPTFIGCSFVANSAPYGGAIDIYNSSPSFYDCYFYNNSASIYGGALYDIYSSNATFTNCVFANNSATDDGWTMLTYESDPSFVNCSIYDRASSESIYNDQGTENLTNTVLFGSPIAEIAGGTATATDCDIDQSLSIISSGSGNFDVNPMYVSPSSNNLQVPNGSVLAQAGLATGAPADDILGNPRPNPPSIGAYEANVVPPVLTSIPRKYLLTKEPDTQITLKGSGFAATSVVYVNYNPVPSTYVSGSKILATIPAADTNAAGTLAIYVATPGATGGESASLSLPVLVTNITMEIGTVTRDASKNYLVPITLSNSGHVAATNVQFSSVTLGNQPAASLPPTISKLRPVTPATFTVTFARTAGLSGQQREVRLSGTYDGGSFDDLVSITLP